MSAGTSRRDSLSRGKNGATSSNTSAANLNGDGAEGTRSRSQSPAKRRAQEMEDGNATDKVEQMDVDASTTPLQNGPFSATAQSVRPFFSLLPPRSWRIAFLYHSLHLVAWSMDLCPSLKLKRQEIFNIELESRASKC